MPVIRRVSLGLSFILTVTIAAVFAFIGTGLVPYWQSLSGQEVQEWFAGPFNRFSIMMVPVHFLSILILVSTFVLHRKERHSRLILIAMLALLVCQAFNFGLYGASLNPALQSLELSADEALATLDRWDYFHPFRTLAAVVSVLALFIASVATPRADA